jgi:hypothetical protein
MIEVHKIIKIVHLYEYIYMNIILKSVTLIIFKLSEEI